MSTRDDGSFAAFLEETLPRFRDEAIAANLRERVEVRVARVAGFRHEAVTPRGLVLGLDEPVAFGGTGSAPDPAEALLAAIGASASVTVTAHAALHRVRIDRVDVALAADIDARAFFEPGAGEPGLLDMTLTLTLVTSAPTAVVERIVADALRVAPVLATLRSKPRIEIVFVQRPEGGM